MDTFMVRMRIETGKLEGQGKTNGHLQDGDIKEQAKGLAQIKD